MRKSTSRASNACDYCRSRKIKCDERKPCSNCSKKSMSCTYVRKLEPTKLETTLGLLYKKITLIEDKLTNIDNEVANKGSSSRRNSLLKPTETSSNIMLPSNASEAPQLFRKPSQSQLQQPQLQPPSDSNYSYVEALINKCQPSDRSVKPPLDFDCTKAQNFNKDIESLFLQDPDILTKIENTHPYMIPESVSSNPSVDDKEEGYLSFSDRSNSLSVPPNEDEFSIKGRLDLPKVQALASQTSLQLNDVTINRLLESFLSNIYPFFPIVCEKAIRSLKDNIFQSGLTSNCETCTFLLVLALSEISEAPDSHPYWSSPSYQDPRSKFVEPPPGYNYFWLSRMIVGRISASEKIGFETVVIQFLSALYYYKIGQLTDYATELMAGSSQLYKFIRREGEKHRERDLLYRLYWVYLHLERNLKAMGQIKRYSALVKLQANMNIPKGCENTFRDSIFDNDSIYSTCFMQNIFLSNIRDKSFTILKSLSKFSLIEIYNIFQRFEQDINNWKKYLPFAFQWEDDLVHFEEFPKPNKVEMDLLKLKYYLTYILSCKILVEKVKNELTHTEFSSLDPDIAKIVKKCIIYTVKSIGYFSNQKLQDLDPNVCFEVLSALAIFKQCKKIINFKKFAENHSLLLLNFDQLLDSCYWRIKCFALHSPLINHELGVMRKEVTTTGE